MLPLYERLDAPKPLCRLGIGKLAFIALSLPLGGFLFCVIWSLLYHFETSTATHCDVANYLPSLSSATGNYEPQRTMWRFAIVLHFPMRLAVSKMYVHYYRDNIRRNRRFLANAACLLNVIENFALLCIALWTSSDDYPIHRNSFITFIVCSEMYMMLSYFLLKNARKAEPLPIEEKSLKYKRNLFIVNVLSFLVAGYCFLRHNSHCEPGVYTLFALFEYIVVFTNMGYHITAYWDFYESSVTFDWKNGLYLTTF